ncbi:hypothetical protein [Paraburkholderia elongata]|uniref:Uncharacterized protein n=1 Tax=Paraburkholderia elongata TaxID=2675747 RepID=A0A972NJV2_9BURK|nr:hypothetical protein [Paraburkholderia elongata]NPT54202.1 hypothetical protein [Paraburkholderia elongata]
MTGTLTSAHDQPLSLEGAKLYLVLEEVDRVVIAIQNLHNAIRGDIDRQEAILTEQRAMLREMRKMNAETAQQFSDLLQSARSVMHSIAEKGLADSISKAVILNIYAELTPRLKEESEQNLAAASAVATGLMSVVTDIHKDTAKMIADAIAGKPPLPAPPPNDAPFTERAKGRVIRSLAKAKRFMVSATHAVVLFTCFVALFTCSVVLYAASHSLKLF